MENEGPTRAKRRAFGSNGGCCDKTTIKKSSHMAPEAAGEIRVGVGLLGSFDLGAV
jgi:hypothetical protein